MTEIDTPLVAHTPNGMTSHHFTEDDFIEPEACKDVAVGDNFPDFFTPLMI